MTNTCIFVTKEDRQQENGVGNCSGSPTVSQNGQEQEPNRERKMPRTEIKSDHITVCCALIWTVNILQETFSLSKLIAAFIEANICSSSTTDIQQLPQMQLFICTRTRESFKSSSSMQLSHKSHSTLAVTL